jgi:hypothetical protein
MCLIILIPRGMMVQKTIIRLKCGIICQRFKKSGIDNTQRIRTINTLTFYPGPASSTQATPSESP